MVANREEENNNISNTRPWDLMSCSAVKRSGKVSSRNGFEGLGFRPFLSPCISSGEILQGCHVVQGFLHIKLGFFKEAESHE